MAGNYATSSDGAEIHFVEDGRHDKPALLLLNSIGTNLDVWSRQVDAFSRSFRLLRYDSRGHGRSSAPEGDYTLEQLAKDALAVLDACGVEAAHLCGLSLGGAVAQRVALDAPRRVQRLVLANTAALIGGSRESWNTRIAAVRAGGLEAIADAVIARFLRDTFRERHPDVSAAIRGAYLAGSAHGYNGCCAALRDGDLREEVQAITAPTLVLAGTFDTATPREDSLDLVPRIAGALPAELPTGHFSNVELPQTFNALVCEFLGD